jgi:hypothetical protein
LAGGDGGPLPCISRASCALQTQEIEDRTEGAEKWQCGAPSEQHEVNAGASATGDCTNLWRRLHLDCCMQRPKLNAVNRSLQSKERLGGRLIGMPFTQPRWQLLQHRSLPLLLAARAAPPAAPPPPPPALAAAGRPCGMTPPHLFGGLPSTAPHTPAALRQAGGQAGGWLVSRHTNSLACWGTAGQQCQVLNARGWEAAPN